VDPFDCLDQEESRPTVARQHGTVPVAVLAALFGGVLVFAGMHDRTALSAAGITIAVAAYAGTAAALVKRWPPWLPVAVATAAAVATTAAGTPDFLIFPALVVAAAAFSTRSERTLAVAAAMAVSGVLLAGHLAFSLHARSGWADLAVVPWIAAAVAFGQAARGAKAHQVMLVERARRAEEGREHEARRRVQQERLRIARELHDAVGHHVALISVQAGAMGYLLDTDPAKARESLAHIQQASEAALEELRLTVGLLRQPGEQEPVEPAGGLARLDELIASFGATGLDVTCHVTGQVRPLPEATDLTAYRVIQESLTNTAKHAAGATATIRLAFRTGVLALAVEDDGPPTAGGAEPTAGHGIIGMRERAVAVGGWLTAGPHDGGGFQVRAELPAPAVPIPPAPSSPAPSSLAPAAPLTPPIPAVAR
jgi:signal transduction histidine kinase